MRQIITLLLLLALMPVLSGIALASDVAQATPPSCATFQFERQSPAQLLAQWRGLRGLRGHFSGGGWNAALDQFHGRKHCLMLTLQARLGRPPFSLASARALLDAPDQQPAGLPKIWLYAWRGEHDMLALILDGHDRVIAVNWRSALE